MEIRPLLLQCACIHSKARLGLKVGGCLNKEPSAISDGYTIWKILPQYVREILSISCLGDHVIIKDTILAISVVNCWKISKFSM